MVKLVFFVVYLFFILTMSQANGWGYMFSPNNLWGFLNLCFIGFCGYSMFKVRKTIVLQQKGKISPRCNTRTENTSNINNKQIALQLREKRQKLWDNENCTVAEMEEINKKIFQIDKILTLDELYSVWNKSSEENIEWYKRINENLYRLYIIDHNPKYRKELDDFNRVYVPLKKWWPNM